MTPPKHGTLSAIGANGSFTYTPAANYNGPDSVTFKANGGTADSSVATYAIVVTSVNDGPVRTGGAVATDAGKPLTGTVSCSDVDGDASAYNLGTAPAHGTHRRPGRVLTRPGRRRATVPIACPPGCPLRSSATARR